MLNKELRVHFLQASVRLTMLISLAMRAGEHIVVYSPVFQAKLFEDVVKLKLKIVLLVDAQTEPRNWWFNQIMEPNICGHVSLTSD